QRAQAPEEHKVQATVAPRALEGGLIGRTLDHTEQAGVAPAVEADLAHGRPAAGMAALAVADVLHGVGQRLRQLERSRPVVLQQVKSHALRRLLPYARQAAQGVDQ